MVGVGLYIYPESNAPSTQVQQITEEHTISTGAGEHKTITFSNGSAITLNSNSSVTYTLGLLHNQTIEVVLEGEAYFDAEGGNEESEPIFSVRTPDGIVRDIGTEFLVTIRNGHSSVVLQEGKVEVDNESRGKEEVKKGEMLTFTKSEVLDRQFVNPTFYTSWATGTMKFNETSIEELAKFIELRFAVEVELVDNDLSDITLDGAIYFKSLEGLVRSVSEVTKIPVYQSEDRDKIYFGKDSCNVNKN
nr:FecR family protein [Fodinibius salicampi]